MTIMGLARTSRGLFATAALALLFLSATRCSTAFVLRVAPVYSRRASTQRWVQERRWTAAAAATATSRRMRGTRPPSSPIVAPKTVESRGDSKVSSIMMMVAGPAEEASAEADASADDEPSIPKADELDDAAAAEEEEEGVGEEVSEAETEVVMEEDGEKDGVMEGEEEEEEEEEEEVDPMAEVKQQIKELEAELIIEENKLRDTQDSIQEKGQMGFLRMAAQVDNYRKTSGAGTGDYEADAKSAVLKALLPAFEPFEAAEEVLNLETENEVKFNSNYQSLYRQLKDVFTKVGATDFYGVVGEKFAYTRHEKVSEEHNPIMEAGLIIKCVSPGLELKKNVIQKAACVVSLGPEKTEEAEAEKDEEGEDAPAAEGAATADGEGQEDEAEEGGENASVENEENGVEEGAAP